jgi:outer membrane protein assembly factor BamB
MSSPRITRRGTTAPKRLSVLPPAVRRAVPAATVGLAATIAVVLLLPTLTGPGVGGITGALPVPAGGALLTDSTDWSTYMQGQNHRGAQTSSVITRANAPNLTMVWNATTGGNIAEQPIVVGTSLYVGSWDGNEYSFNVTTGALQWKTFVGVTMGCGMPNGRGPSSTATYLNGTLYFTGGGTNFTALNAANGSLEWQTYLMNNSPKVGFYGWASAMLHDGYAYVGLASSCSLPNIVGGMAKISLTSHRITNRLVTTPPGSLGADIWGTPTYDAITNTVFASTGNDSIVEPYDEAQLQLNPKTLAIENNWTVPPALHVADGDFGTTPVMVTTVGGRLLDVAANKDGLLFALNRTNLSAGPLWATRISSDASYSSIAFAKNEIYVGSSHTTVHDQLVNGSVRAINASTGGIRWAYTMPGKVYSSISYVDGLVAADGGNEIVLLNSLSGKAVWRYYANTSFQGAISFAHGMMFVGGENGELFAFGIFSGGSGPSGVPSHGLGAGAYAAELQAIRARRAA